SRSQMVAFAGRAVSESGARTCQAFRLSGGEVTWGEGGGEGDRGGQAEDRFTCRQACECVVEPDARGEEAAPMKAAAAERKRLILGQARRDCRCAPSNDATRSFVAITQESWVCQVVEMGQASLGAVKTPRSSRLCLVAR